MNKNINLTVLKRKKYKLSKKETRNFVRNSLVDQQLKDLRIDRIKSYSVPIVSTAGIILLMSPAFTINNDLFAPIVSLGMVGVSFFWLNATRDSAKERRTKLKRLKLDRKIMIENLKDNFELEKNDVKQLIKDKK